PLQDYTSRVTTSALQLSGVPSFREGNVIVLPSLSLGVVEACSGIRSLITLLALASAAAVLLIPSDRRIAQVFVALS
ncbi:MAG: exosortase A, partial [Rhodocyclales bacterium CG17_big_fil_post_rev_8_21_14_2_50_68_7]